jgi:hypothetical protein
VTLKLVLAAAAAALPVGTALASAATIEVGTGDWRNIPMMQQFGEALDSNSVAAIYEMAEKGKCVMPGQRKGKLDMTVPFIVLFAPSGSIDRLVIEQMGCTKAEGVLAGALIKLIDRGAFRPSGGMREGWFRGEVSFSHFDS